MNRCNCVACIDELPIPKILCPIPGSLCRRGNALRRIGFIPQEGARSVAMSSGGSARLCALVRECRLDDLMVTEVQLKWMSADIDE